MNKRYMCCFLAVTMVALLMAANAAYCLPKAGAPPKPPSDENQIRFAEDVVTSLTIQADPMEYKGTLPTNIKLSGTVQVSAKCSLYYAWVYNIRVVTTPQHINFPAKGSRALQTTWQVKYPGYPEAQLEVWLASEGRVPKHPMKSAFVRPHIMPGSSTSAQTSTLAPHIGEVTGGDSSTITLFSAKPKKTPAMVAHPGTTGKVGPAGHKGPIIVNPEVILAPTVTADPTTSLGPVPVNVKFTAKFTATKACEVKYKWVIDGTETGDAQILSFDGSGTKTADTTITVDKVHQGWGGVVVMSPMQLKSNRAAYHVALPIDHPVKAQPILPRPIKPNPAHPKPHPGTGAREVRVAFDPMRAKVQNDKGTWFVMAERTGVGGYWVLEKIGADQATAERALAIIQSYGINTKCYVGDGVDPTKNPAITYYLANGAAPQGSIQGEISVQFDPASLHIQQAMGGWRVMLGNPERAVTKVTSSKTGDFIISQMKNYGFDYVCSPDQYLKGMQYFKK